MSRSCAKTRPTLRRVVAGLLAALPGMGSIVFLIGLIYYVFAIMATKLFGDDNPNLFGTLGDSLFTLFTVMTLEGWTNDVARPVMQNHPYAWVFFVVYIVITTFMVLNLFIGVVVNAMQEEASKLESVEREVIQEEAAPILAEVKIPDFVPSGFSIEAPSQPAHLLGRAFDS